MFLRSCLFQKRSLIHRFDHNFISFNYQTKLKMSTDKINRSLEEANADVGGKKAKLAIYPYLYFAGNANEAIDFYAKVFKASVPVRMTFKDGPGGGCPEVQGENMSDKIMHANITFGDVVIMISDNSATENTTAGTNVQLSIDMEDLEETTRIYNELHTDGGKVVMPLAKQFWGATFGKVVDPFGVVWGLNCCEPRKEDPSVESAACTEKGVKAAAEEV